MTKECEDRIVKASKGKISPARAKELLVDFVEEQEKLLKSGEEMKLSNLSGNEQYKRWLEKGVQQERFNRYNDVLKRQDLRARINLNSLDEASESVEQLFANVEENIDRTRVVRSDAFRKKLQDAKVDNIYFARRFDQYQTSIFLSRLMTRNEAAKPTLASIDPRFTNEFKIAEVLADQQFKSYGMKTNLGVPLGFLENRIGRNFHNPHTLSIPEEANAWREWASSDENVDWDIMFLDGKTREQYLKEMRGNIISGTHSGDDGISLFSRGGVEAVQMEAEQIEFNDFLENVSLDPTFKSKDYPEGFDRTLDMLDLPVAKTMNTDDVVGAIETMGILDELDINKVVSIADKTTLRDLYYYAKNNNLDPLEIFDNLAHYLSEKLGPREVREMREGSLASELERIRLSNILNKQAARPFKVAANLEAKAPDQILVKQKQKLYGSLAAAAGKQRKFMIKPEKWLEYNERFGNGDLVTAMNNEILRDARIESMLRNFGSNPEANLQSVIADVVNSTKDWGKGGKHRLESMMQDKFDFISGRLDDNAQGVLARVGRSNRLFQAADKLGSAVFSSFGDFVTPSLGRAQFLGTKGVAENYTLAATTLADNFQKAVGKFGSKTAKAIYESQLEEMQSMMLFMRREIRYMDEFSIDVHGKQNKTVLDKALNLNDTIHSKIGLTNMLETYTNARVASNYDAIARDLGVWSDTAFADLPAHQQKQLEYHGLKDIWDLVRSKTVEDNGKKYLTPTALDDITDAELEAFDVLAKTSRGKAELREKLKIQLRTGFAQQAHTRIPMPNVNTDLKAIFKLRPGTLGGEAGLAMAQFKNYPVSVWKKLIAPTLRNNKSALAAYYSFAVPTGMLGLWMKDILSGESPRPFFNIDGEADAEALTKNWVGLLFAVSGVPVIDRILADFIGGERPQKGKAFADLLGPTFGYIADQGINAWDVVAGLGTGDEEQAAKGATKAALSAPIISPILHANIFSRTVKNLVDHTLLESASPGYLDNLEHIAEKQGKQYYSLSTDTDLFIEDLLEKGLVR